MSNISKHTLSAFNALNPQDRRLVRWFADGKNIAQIQDEFHLTQSTLGKKVGELMNELKLSSRANFHASTQALGDVYSEYTRQEETARYTADQVTRAAKKRTEEINLQDTIVHSVGAAASASTDHVLVSPVQEVSKKPSPSNDVKEVVAEHSPLTQEKFATTFESFKPMWQQTIATVSKTGIQKPKTAAKSLGIGYQGLYQRMNTIIKSLGLTHLARDEAIKYIDILYKQFRNIGIKEYQPAKCEPALSVRGPCIEFDIFVPAGPVLSPEQGKLNEILIDPVEKRAETIAEQLLIPIKKVEESAVSLDFITPEELLSEVIKSPEEPLLQKKPPVDSHESKDISLTQSMSDVSVAESKMTGYGPSVVLQLPLGVVDIDVVIGTFNGQQPSTDMKHQVASRRKRGLQPWALVLNLGTQGEATVAQVVFVEIEP